MLAAVTVALVVDVILYIVLNRTVFGRSLYLVGSNPRAETVAGLPVKRVLVTTDPPCSGLATLGALTPTARTGSSEPNLGGSLSLQAVRVRSSATFVGLTATETFRESGWSALNGTRL